MEFKTGKELKQLKTLAISHLNICLLAEKTQMSHYKHKSIWHECQIEETELLIKKIDNELKQLAQ